MDSTERKIRQAFGRISKDIQEIKGLQKSSFEALSARLESSDHQKDKELQLIFSRIDKLDDSGKKNLADWNEKFIRLRSESEKLNEYIREDKKDKKKREKTLSLMQNKLQEFENISVDIDDVEQNFITRDEVMPAIEASGELRKQVRALESENERLKKQLADMDEKIQKFAYEEDLKRVQDDLIDLRSEIISRKDLENMNDRLDSVEEKMFKRTDKIADSAAKLEKHLVDVFALKKSFATKEQYNMMRKEIRLLTKGLKKITR